MCHTWWCHHCQIQQTKCLQMIKIHGMDYQIYQNTKILAKYKLEQLECLCSEDTLRRLMITHTIESYWIPSQSNKFKEFDKITNFWILKQTLHTVHLLKLLEKMCKYEMDPTSIVEDTKRTRFCPQTDRRTDKVKPVYPPFNFVEAGGIISISGLYWVQ